MRRLFQSGRKSHFLPFERGRYVYRSRGRSLSTSGGQLISTMLEEGALTKSWDLQNPTPTSIDGAEYGRGLDTEAELPTGGGVEGRHNVKQCRRTYRGGRRRRLPAHLCFAHIQPGREVRSVRAEGRCGRVRRTWEVAVQHIIAARPKIAAAQRAEFLP